MRKQIDIEKLRNTFRIRNGILERIDYRYSNDKWKPVKLCSNHIDGYCQVKFDNTMIFYHIIIWILSTGKDIPTGLEIDHINGNRIDNRMTNLRLVTSRGNSQNMGKHRDGKLVGCYYNKHNKKFIASIYISGKNVYIGLFKTEQKAHEAYKTACKHIKSYVDNESFRELIKKEMDN
jgi:hypothetical protein